MNNMILRQIKEAVKNVSDVGEGLLFRKFSFSFENLIKVTLVAEFGDDVAVSVTGEDLKAEKDVRMFEFFQNINLGKEELL